MTWREAKGPIRHLGEHRNDWDRLNRQLLRGHPFSDTRFVEAMLSQLGHGKPRMFVHESNGSVDGIVIMEKRRNGIWGPFLPSQLQAAPLLVPDTAALLNLFRDLPGPVIALELLRQDPRFAVPGLLDRDGRSRSAEHAITMEVELAGSFDTYWASRSRNLVKNIRRYQRRAEAEPGGIRFRVLTQPDDMAAAVARYGALESSGWKQAAGTAVSKNNTQGRFYTEVMQTFAHTGQASVFEYWIGNSLAASRLVISGANMHVILKTAYDESMSQFAPGRLLLHAVLERAFEEKSAATVEFYTNATQDQLSWATNSRTIRHVTIFRHPWLATCYELLRGRECGAGAGSRGQNDDT